MPELEEQVAEEISRVLAAGDGTAQALREEIAAVLQQIDAGGIVVRAALAESDERVRQDIIAAVEVLGMDFAELRFLIGDVSAAAALIQESLDVQGADIRAIIEQNRRQSADIRLFRDDVAVIARWREAGGRPDTVGDSKRLRWVRGCPYRGLVPFEEADAEVFYGRERLTAELAVLLATRAERGGIVVLTGASGAGKSSLLRAGLLPKLAGGRQVAGSQHWPRIIMTPTRQPLTELAAQLAALGGGSALSIRDDLSRDPDRSNLAVRAAVLADAAGRGGRQARAAEGGARLALVVDQFEEVFTLSPDSGGETEREAFIRALRAIAAHPATGLGEGPPAVVVIAVRGDFWDRCAAYSELADALQEGQFVVGPMSESDLRRAITGPADAAGLGIDPSLTGLILEDLRAAGGDAGMLPLLSQAMTLTWENREDGRLTSQGYGQSGGISRAVQVSADAVYDSLPADQQELARHLLRLMTVADRDGRLTRRPVTKADLYAGNHSGDRSQVDGVLEAFAARRLIVLDEGTAQICHDSLLSAWPRLRTWLEEDQASWILHGQLADDAAAWHDHHGDPSFLYRGTQLATLQEAAARWSTGPGRSPALNATEVQFLQASQSSAARSARRRRSGVAALALLTMAALITSAFAFQQRSHELEQRNQAIYNEVSAEALQASTTDPSLAAELTLADYRLHPTQGLASQLITTENTPLSTPLTTHSNSLISSVAFSPDGRTLASGDDNGTIRLWDVTTPQHPRLLAHLQTDSIGITLAFSPNGRTLAGGGNPNIVGEGAIWLWDVSRPTHPRPLGQPLSPNGKPVNRNALDSVESVVFSPDGRILASGGSFGNNENTSTIQLWDVSNPERPRPLGQCGTSTGRRSNIGSLAFSPDGRTLVGNEYIGPSGGTIRLWNVGNAAHPRLLGRPPGDGNGYDSVSFSRDSILAAGGNSGSVQLWNMANPALPRKLGHPLGDSTQPVDSVVFSSDGHTMASSDDGSVRLWNVTNPARPQPFSQPLSGSINGGASSFAFSPDGRSLASGEGNGTIQLWDIPQTIVTGSGNDDQIAFSPDGRILASENYGVVRLWNVASSPTASQIVQLPGASNQLVARLAFSPDSKTLATIEAKGGAYAAQLWNVANPAQPQPLGHRLAGGGSFGVASIAFSPAGPTLAIGDANGMIQLWNTENPARPRPFKQVQAGTYGGYPVTSMAFSNDGRMLASIDILGNLEVWTVSGLPDQLPAGATTAADSGSILYSPDISYSPDDRMLALLTDNGEIELWDMTRVSIPKRLGQLPAVTTGVFSSLAFSRQGTLATGDDNGTIQLWNDAGTAHPKPVGQPIGGGSGITAMAFGPDGTLASSTSAGTIMLWHLRVGDAIKRICATARGNLTPKNWHHYIPQLPYQSPCDH